MLLFGAAVRNGRKVPVPARPYRCSKSSSGSSCKRALDDLASLPDGIEVVATPLRHTHPLIPVLAAVIDAANRLPVTVPQSPFNCVRVPEAHFITPVCGGCRPPHPRAPTNT